MKLVFLFLILSWNYLSGGILEKGQEFLLSNDDICTFSSNYENILFDGELFFCHYQLDENCKATIFNHDSSREFTFEIPYDLIDNEYPCEIQEIHNLSYTNGKLFFNNYAKILMYEFDGNNFIFKKIYDVNKIFPNTNISYVPSFKVINNVVHGLILDYNSSNEFHEKPGYFSFDLSNTLKNKWVQPLSIEGFYWTLFQPRICMDVNESNLIVSDITSYRIKIYDTKGNILDTLTRTIDDWRAVKYKNDDFKYKEPRYYINKLQGDSITTSLIHRVEFVKEDHILVCYSINRDKKSQELYQLYYDLWEKDGNSWILKYHDIKNTDINEDNSDPGAPRLDTGYFIYGEDVYNIRNGFDNDGKAYILKRSIIL